VVNSTGQKPTAVVVQAYLQPTQRGEFGNLLRVSKTRDHWELTTHTAAGAIISSRLNTQRDSAASDREPLSARPRLSQERLFGSVAAWINNVLVCGHSTRLNCEWISRNETFFIVQIDAEDEDFIGVNPFQLRIEPIYEPPAGSAATLRAAESPGIAHWDKLKVLEDLWGDGIEHRPHLFYAAVSDIPESNASDRFAALVRDFEQLIGPNNIVVRTTVKSSCDKVLNLPRTECLSPVQAAEWCVAQKKELRGTGHDLSSIAFVMHRYIASRSSAWARADPADPTVEINGIWGLPDALQYCPYDIWEVHVPTSSATDYPEYKSNMLLAQEDGSWKYVRTKNEIARALSVTRKDAGDIAERTYAIARRLGQPCHVMWLVGCIDQNGESFNVPWYWVHAYKTEKNEDRSRHISFVVSDRASLARLKDVDLEVGHYMIVLRPDKPALFRDNDFLKEVGKMAREQEMPIVLEGSTLAHAYYQLVRDGCTVIATGEKEYSRVRKNTPLGKIVRDKIPGRIAARQELGVTTEIPTNTRRAFLIGKILEEALEVREGRSDSERKIELADVLEVIRALAELSGFDLAEIIRAADAKREKLGGFDQGLVLLQTGIGGPGQTTIQPRSFSAQVLSRIVSSDTIEIPFTFFGFAEVGQPRGMSFANLGIVVELTLKSDRIVVRVIRTPEQLELPLSLEVEEGSGS